MSRVKGLCGSGYGAFSESRCRVDGVIGSFAQWGFCGSVEKLFPPEGDGNLNLSV